jgi:hypothetical protein
MKTESIIRILAGSIVLLGTCLAWLVSPWWLILPAFASINLIQSAFTGFCPPTIIMTKLGWVDRDGMVHFGGGKGV